MKILIIDDNDIDRRLLKGILEQSWKNYEIMEAESGSKGLEMIALKAPDLVILDIYMSPLNGFDVLKEIREKQFSFIPVLLVSSFAGDRDKIEGLELGAVDFINKPIVAEDVKARVAVQLKIKKMLDDMQWASEKTNQGIRALYKELEKKNKESEEMVRRLDELTLTDPLTGALNRRGLQRALSREVAWVNRYGTSLIAILLDLDNFKQINDTHGLSAGDAILKEVVKNLRNTLRPVDYVARIGGDEFIILLAQTRLGDGFGVAEKIRYTISETQCILNDIEVRATASLGLAQVTEECSSVEELVRKCQYVLKRSKTLGKNRVSYSEIQDDVKDGLLEGVLYTMSLGQSYRVVKQPIFHLTERTIAGYEFLTRLNVSMFEMPEDFFHISRANNMLTLVDRHCLHHCAQAGQKLPCGLRKHLNIYPTTVMETPIKDILKEFPLQGLEDFCLELSENLITTDLSLLLKPVQIMKERGIRIAIDDVGFGKSCLESLVILEPDIVKIDKKINIGIAKDNGRQRSLDRLLKVVRSLNAQVIVEGIESEDDLMVIRSMGVELGQGFLLGHPA
ncbi:MAG: diguanylate cyclase [Candidatus Omnitrophica bacterium]|nr:diguanylate cyclase [Candidatus Omnitrophota bacterium]